MKINKQRFFFQPRKVVGNINHAIIEFKSTRELTAKKTTPKNKFFETLHGKYADGVGKKSIYITYYEFTRHQFNTTRNGASFLL